MGNTLDYYNDDMSRKAVGKLFDDMDDFDGEEDLPPESGEYLANQDTSSIVVGYDDNSSEPKRRQVHEPVYESAPMPVESPRDPAMERALERAAELAGGQPARAPERVEHVKREPEPAAESGRPARSRAFADEDYDMGMYRREHSFINNDEYEELMRPRKRIRSASADRIPEGHPEPAVIRRATSKDESSMSPRRRPTKADSDEYLERAQTHREHGDMKRAANAYHRSKALRPYIMGLFVIMMMAMALMLFRIVAQDTRIAEATTELEGLRASIEGFTAIRTENDDLRTRVDELLTEIEELQANQAPPEQTEPDAQPSQAPGEIELPTRYTVVRGDSLFRISERFYGSQSQLYVNKIKEANNMTTDTVHVDDTLYIPEI